jgi:hypothetical protein
MTGNVVAAETVAISGPMPDTGRLALDDLHPINRIIDKHSETLRGTGFTLRRRATSIHYQQIIAGLSRK